MSEIELKRIAKETINNTYIKDMKIVEIKDKYFVVNIKGSKYLITKLGDGFIAVLCGSKDTYDEIYIKERDFYLHMGWFKISSYH